MNDDWRLQIDLDDAGVSGQINDHLRAAELEHDLETAFDQRVIVSHEGERIFLYAGDRGQLDFGLARLKRRGLTYDYVQLQSNRCGSRTDATLRRWWCSRARIFAKRMTRPALNYQEVALCDGS